MYIEASILKAKAAKPKGEELPESTRMLSKFEYLLTLKNALEISAINKQLSGSLETYITTLRGILKLAMVLKY